MADPHGGRIPSGHSAKEHASLLGIGAGLAGYSLARYLRRGACPLCHRFFHHINRQPGRRRLEYLSARLALMSVVDHSAIAVRYTQETDGLLINAAIAQHAERGGHFNRRQAGGAKRQTKGCLVDMLFADPHTQQKVC